MKATHFLYTAEGKEFLEREYRDKKRTPRDLAESLSNSGFKTYHKLVVRALEHHEIPVRDKSEAQAEALKAERAKHPTKGKPRDQDTREQISKTLKGTKNE